MLGSVVYDENPADVARKSYDAFFISSEKVVTAPEVLLSSGR
jgi:hypothetical protein